MTRTLRKCAIPTSGLPQARPIIFRHHCVIIIHQGIEASAYTQVTSEGPLPLALTNSPSLSLQALSPASTLHQEGALLSTHSFSDETPRREGLTPCRLTGWEERGLPQAEDRERDERASTHFIQPLAVRGKGPWFYVLFQDSASERPHGVHHQSWFDSYDSHQESSPPPQIGIEVMQCDPSICATDNCALGSAQWESTRWHHPRDFPMSHQHLHIIRKEPFHLRAGSNEDNSLALRRVSTRMLATELMSRTRSFTGVWDLLHLATYFLPSTIFDVH